MLGDPLSHGLWERTAPDAPETAPLEGAATADVAVIGAGYTGLSAALHLAQAGVRVTVLEAAGIGFGGSGRNVGLVNAGLWVTPDDLEATLGPAHGPALLELLGKGPAEVWDIVKRHGIDCEATPNGTLHCAHGPKGFAGLEARAEQWQRRGAPVRLLDRAETAARIGSDLYEGALLDMRAGTIQPLAYARGLARAAIGAGAILHTGSPVETLERSGNLWRLKSPRGTVDAGQVIVATNAYSGHLLPEIRSEITHLPFFNFATEPLDPALLQTVLPGLEGCWDTRDVLTAFRLDRAGRLLLGSVGALSGTGGRIHRAWAQRKLKRLFPQLSDVGFTTGWYGMIGMTADAMPRLHRPAPGVISLSGYNGRGIAPGTVLGRLVAARLLDRISDADMPLPLTEPAPAPRKRLSEAWYVLGSQLYHGFDARP